MLRPKAAGVLAGKWHVRPLRRAESSGAQEIDMLGCLPGGEVEGGQMIPFWTCLTVGAWALIYGFWTGVIRSGDYTALVTGAIISGLGGTLILFAALYGLLNT